MVPFSSLPSTPLSSINVHNIKQYPSSPEAEKGVLSAFLLDSSILDKYLQEVISGDFFSSQNRIIFESMYNLRINNKLIDVIILHEDLSRRSLLEEVGGIEYLFLLQENIGALGYVDEYVKILREKSSLREIISSASILIQQCYDQNNDGILFIVDRAEKLLFDIAHRRSKGGFFSLDILLKNTFHSLSSHQGSPRGINGIVSGFFQLDQLTCGFQSSDLIIIAARPSMGKTALALCIAQSAACAGYPVGFVSLEMSSEQLVMRMLSARSKIKLSSLRSGFLTSDDWLRLTHSAAYLSEGKIFIDDTPYQSILDLRTKARKLVLENNIKIFFIDYLQLLHTQKKHESRHHEVSEISRFLKSLAKELNIVIVALSQLSRGVESRVEKRPILSDLRDSGAIEQDADMILFLYRDIVYNPSTENPNSAEIIIGKHRNGPTGTVVVEYERDYTLFKDF